MMKVSNKVYLEGYLYEHDLEKKVTGATSKNPNTEYITGTISIATDDACVNIVPVHYTYVTALTKNGSANAAFNVLNAIINGTVPSIMEHGKENAARVRVDTVIGLNEFYSNRNGKEEFISVKRNEGGFIHLATDVSKEEDRNKFEVDMIITNAIRVEGDPERNTQDKMVIKGVIFDFRNAILPIELSGFDERFMKYMEDAEVSPKNPMFTRIRGKQVSENIVRRIVEPSAWGDDDVREVVTTRKDFVVTWSKPVPHEWDDPSTITANELKEAMAARETYLATLKKRNDDYKASKAATPSAIPAPSASTTEFNF